MNLNEELKKYKLQTPISIRYNDLDTLKHVNNAVYLMYLEEARIHYAKQVFQWKGDLDQLNMVVASIKIDFLRPVFLNSPLVIHTRVAKMGAKSFEMEYCLVIEERERQLAARATSSIVYYDPKTRSSCPIPVPIRQAIQNFEEPDLILK